MRSPWLQLLLLVLYFLLVLVATRLLDLILWYQHGLSSTQIVNPILLKVQQIKLLLDSRGVSYTEYFEKNELVQLLQESAEVTIGEIEQVSETTAPLKERLKPGPVISHFSGGAHFYEQVEDTRDSVWLVQVVTSNEPLLDEYNWRLVCSQLEPFGVRIGVFDCRQDAKLCETKGWSKPLLLLAMPKGRKSKDKVVLQPFTSRKPQVIVDWVHQQLSLWVKHVQSIEEIEEEWLAINQSGIVNSSHVHEPSHKSSDDSVKPSVRVLLLSHLLQPPLFLAALSIKFTGRVHFGMFSVKKEDSDVVRKRLRLHEKKFPVYLVITPEQKVMYGSRKLEYFNMWSMNVFLCGIQPETNDVFLWSLLLANMLVSLTVCLISTRFWWRWTAYSLWTLIKYNLWLFTAWLVFLAMARFAVFGVIIEQLLLMLRVFGLSEWGSFVRTEVALLSFHPLVFFLSFLSFCIAASCLIRFFSPTNLISSPNELELDSRPWWEVLPMDSYWVNYLFRPMASLSRPIHTSPIELEDGLEMLIERLVVPNFWLQPVIPVDYIKDLPIWKYHGFRVVEEQPRTTSCSKDKLVLHSSSPKLLEHLMDADDPHLIVCCCGTNVQSGCQTSNTFTSTQRQACTRSCNCCKRETHSNSICCSKISPKALRLGKSYLQSQCSCVPTSELNRTASSTAEQSQHHLGHCGNAKPSTSGNSCCVSCFHKFKETQHCDYKHYHLCETDLEESDASDSDNIGWSAPGIMLQTTDCAVCLESYNHGAVLCGLPCGHNYHQQCILTWLQRDNHHCPVCRWPAYRMKSHKNHLHQE